MKEENKMLGTNEQYFFTVKINGVMQPVRVPTRGGLQPFLDNLPVDQRMVAEVVQVDQLGREILLG
jgi:hypothetical protein